MMPCPSCKSPTKPWDTEPSHGHLTYAYECRCGNEWTEDMDYLLRRHKLTRASEIKPERWRASQRDVVEAVRDVIPEAWRVLPGGASTAKRIAQRANERRKERMANFYEQPCFCGSEAELNA